VKEKCFEYYPLEKETKLDDECDLCITAIDSKNRALNRIKENNKNASNK